MSSLCKTWKPEYNWTKWLPQLGVYFHFLHFMCFNVCFSGPYSRYLLFTFYCWGVNNTKCEGKVLKIVLLLLLCIVIQHIFQVWVTHLSGYQRFYLFPVTSSQDNNRRFTWLSYHVSLYVPWQIVSISMELLKHSNNLITDTSAVIASKWQSIQGCTKKCVLQFPVHFFNK